MKKTTVASLALALAAITGCSADPDSASITDAPAEPTWQTTSSTDPMTDVATIVLWRHSADKRLMLGITCRSSAPGYAGSIHSADIRPSIDGEYLMDTRFDQEKAETFQTWFGVERAAFFPDAATEQLIASIGKHTRLLVRINSHGMRDSVDGSFDLSGFSAALPGFERQCQAIAPKWPIRLGIALPIRLCINAPAGPPAGGRPAGRHLAGLPFRSP